MIVYQIKQKFFILDDVSNSKIASALKLLAIYSYSLQKFSTKFLKPTFNVEQLAQQLTLKNSNAQDQLAKTITTFAAENQYSKFSVVTSNMIVLGRKFSAFIFNKNRVDWRRLFNDCR